MKIAALDGKFKTDDMIHLDELVNKAGESLYETAWKENPFTDVEPFYRAIPKKRKKNATETEAKISTVIMQDNEPEFFSQLISFAYAYEDKKDDIDVVSEAHRMLMTIRQKLWVILGNAQLPYNVLLNNGNLVDNSDINGGMWLMKPNSIFCTGYFPIKRGGKRLWGRLLFKKEQALECIKNINRDPIIIQPESAMQSAVEDDEDDSEDDEMDPRERISLLRIILTFSIRHYPSAMIKDDPFSIGDKIERLANEYGYHINRQTVAKMIKWAKEMPEWEKYLDLHKEDNKKSNSKFSVQ